MLRDVCKVEILSKFRILQTLENSASQLQFPEVPRQPSATARSRWGLANLEGSLKHLRRNFFISGHTNRKYQNLSKSSDSESFSSHFQVIFKEIAVCALADDSVTCKVSKTLQTKHLQ